jgi:molybdate transport system substrate-binding protein
MLDTLCNPLRILTLIGLLVASLGVRAEEPARIFAAASLTNALNDVGAAWKQAGHPLPSLAFAASSALAKQIDSGAPADVFASADLTWMDYLDERGRIVPGSRVNLLANELVLIAPKGKPVNVEMKQGFDIASAFTGKLCTGEPGVVPVGIYAQQSLQNLGWWDSLQGRIVGTDDVRTALAFVARGECPLGIVYATDAKISDKVEVVARFPEATHKPILYPVALVKGGRADAAAFMQFVTTSPEAAAIFTRYGFTKLAP